MKHPTLAALLALICLFTFVSCASSPSEPSVTDIVALKPGMPWSEGQEIFGDAYRFVDSILEQASSTAFPLSMLSRTIWVFHSRLPSLQRYLNL